MSGFVETHRSFVNTWECDENDHMNVQFYMKRFDEAARFHAAFEGGRIDGSLPTVRHLRYHAELHAGDTTAVRSGTIASGPNAGRVVHLLENPASGRLCATAIDSPADAAAGATEGLLAEMPETARPRSLGEAPEPFLGKATIMARGGLVTNRRIVQPASCTIAGEMLAQDYVGITSDGAPHVWHHANFGNGWLLDNGYGRVAVEMKATFSQPARAGDAIELVSSPAEIGSRTIRLHHEFVRLSDDAVLAALDVVALVINLATRRAVGAEEFLAIRGASTGA